MLRWLSLKLLQVAAPDAFLQTSPAQYVRPFSQARPFLYLLDPLFLFSLGLYCLNRFWFIPSGCAVPAFFRYQFADLLLIPVAMPVLVWVHRWLGVRKESGPPTAREIAQWLIIWSLLFECFFPIFLGWGTADLWDILAYTSGALLAYLFWQGFYTLGVSAH